MGAGKLVVFAGDGDPVVLAARVDENSVFVLGIATAQPHGMHLGKYPVSTAA